MLKVAATCTGQTCKIVNARIRRRLSLVRESMTWLQNITADQLIHISYPANKLHVITNVVAKSYFPSPGGIVYHYIMLYYIIRIISYYTTL